MPTTNNNWPTPVATDLVKDGWEAIKDLGDAIDTTLGVYAPSTPGLTLINTTSFSAVASQSFNDVFSATYDNYEIVLTIEFSAGVNGFLRMRSAGTDLTGSVYNTQTLTMNDTSVGGARTVSQTSHFVMTGGTSVPALVKISFAGPFKTDETSILSIGNTSQDTIRAAQSYGIVNNTTSYDGFTIFPSSGTITGIMRAYGYNN
jgi:hypothetical protein